MLSGGGFAGGPFILRVLRPAGGRAFAGIATSAAQMPIGTSTQVFPTQLPIQAGDLVGVDDTNINNPDLFGIGFVTGAMGSVRSPHLADGRPAAVATGGVGGEIGFNADVATQPPNRFSFGSR